jgi:hypothetical protein
MPRRKPKHAFRAGEPSANPYGRPPGSVNEINRRIKEAFTMILENKLPELEEWLTRAAHKDPLKTADLLLRISERFTPSLSRTEITGAEGTAFSPITINLPNIPKISLGEGAPVLPLDSPRELGEGAPTEIPVFLQEPPAKEIISEGAPAEDSREFPLDKL